jgi:hypothetical protein
MVENYETNNIGTSTDGLQVFEEVSQSFPLALVNEFGL